jgi:hypothetical protein
MQSLRARFAIVGHVAMQHFSRREQNNKGMPIWLFYSQRRKIVTKLIFAATAAVFLASPALAQQSEHSFTRDGVTYTYTSTSKGDSQILEGSVAQTGDTFRLVVRNGWVSGKAAGANVSFRVPKPARRVEVAER